MWAVVPSVKKKKKGRTINISSVVGSCAMPFVSLYSSAKYAVERITDSLGPELAPFNIQWVWHQFCVDFVFNWVKLMSWSQLSSRNNKKYDSYIFLVQNNCYWAWSICNSNDINTSLNTDHLSNDDKTKALPKKFAEIIKKHHHNPQSADECTEYIAKLITDENPHSRYLT